MFDKTVDDWKRKCNDLQNELEQALTDSRGHAADVYRLRAQLDEAHDSTEAIRRENKNLAGKASFTQHGTAPVPRHGVDYVN